MDSGFSRRVISVCTLKHSDVWKLTSTLLPDHLEANEYLVYVPENEVDEFKKITDSRVQVVPETSLTSPYRQELHQKLLDAGNEWRFGWYFQQFLKIEAVLASNCDSTIIWDADCVPINNIQMFDANNVPLFMQASEYHEAYFLTIKKLLKIERIQDYSFIIPGFPILKSWIYEFISEIENINENKNWHEALLDSIDLSQKSGFSEFETIGTWLVNAHPDGFLNKNYKWERFGQSRFGAAKNFDRETITLIGQSEGLDIISFENWDKKVRLSKLRNSANSALAIVKKLRLKIQIL